MQRKTMFGWVVATSLFAGAATAAPIAYEGALFDGVTATGAVSSTGNASSPEAGLSDYWSFSAVAGETVTVTVLRLERDLDPALWIFEGTFADDIAFGSALDVNDPGFIAVADDEVANPGPWGDPRASFAAPSTGVYTAIVTNYASGPDDGGDGVFDYQITAENVTDPAPVPVPAAMPLLLAGIGLFGAMSRRRATR